VQAHEGLLDGHRVGQVDLDMLVGVVRDRTRRPREADHRRALRQEVFSDQTAHPAGGSGDQGDAPLITASGVIHENRLRPD
jgi:hypothetical protein